MRRIPATELRKRFNDAGYWEKVKSKVFREEVLKESHPSPPRAVMPVCTQSQYLAYYDRNDQKIAEVHQYKLVDGTLGGSGLPDPKRLIGRNEVLIPLPEEETPPPPTPPAASGTSPEQQTDISD